MAYEFKGRKAVGTQLARVVAKEFDRALEEVGGSQIVDRTEAVHEARKPSRRSGPSCVCSREISGKTIAS